MYLPLEPEEAFVDVIRGVGEVVDDFPLAFGIGVPEMADARVTTSPTVWRR